MFGRRGGVFILFAVALGLLVVSGDQITLLLHQRVEVGTLFDRDPSLAGLLNHAHQQLDSNGTGAHCVVQHKLLQPLILVQRHAVEVRGQPPNLLRRLPVRFISRLKHFAVPQLQRLRQLGLALRNPNLVCLAEALQVRFELQLGLCVIDLALCLPLCLLLDALFVENVVCAVALLGRPPFARFAQLLQDLAGHVARRARVGDLVLQIFKRDQRAVINQVVLALVLVETLVIELVGQIEVVEALLVLAAHILHFVLVRPIVVPGHQHLHFVDLHIRVCLPRILVHHRNTHVPETLVPIDVDAFFHEYTRTSTRNVRVAV